MTFAIVRAVAVSTLFALCLQSSSAQKRPNVMIILADDVGTGDVPGYWNTGLVSMPNLEDLVANGVTFTDAHSTPLCAPSRYVLLSGNYPHRGSDVTGTWSMNYGQGSQFKDGQQSLANVLRNYGYRTSMYGKWHLGGKIPTYKNFTKNDFDYATETEFATKYALSNQFHKWGTHLKEGPWDIGFDVSYMTMAGIQTPPYAFLRNGKFSKKDLQNVKYWDQGGYMTPNGYSKILQPGEGVADWDSTIFNMILVNETESFVKTHLSRRSDDPFFTYVALGSVHAPHSPQFKYLDGSRVHRKYPGLHMDLLGEMDKVVGSLVQILEDNGVLNDTIIVFTSDNGGLGKSVKFGHTPSGPLRGQKGSVYEGGHRVPFIMRWDNGNLPKGEKRQHLIGLNDLYATILEYAGITKPRIQGNDSISFAKYAQNQNMKMGLRKELGFWLYQQGKHTYSALRDRSMKLVYNHLDKKSELYDLSNDLFETTDISSNHTDLVLQMKSRLLQLGPCQNRPGKFRIKFNHSNVTMAKNCGWVSKKWQQRCYLPEAVLHCAKTCRTGGRKACASLVEI